MAEVAYGNYPYQGYQAQGMQQYNHGMPNTGYNSHVARYNPYQRPSPPMQQAGHRQSPPLMAYKPVQMINRHAHQQPGMHGWNTTHTNNMKMVSEDYNANSQQMPVHNGNWQHGNWMAQQNRMLSTASPPMTQQHFRQTTSPIVQGMPNVYEQAATMRRRMSSSSQSSDYSATSGVQPSTNDNRWMVSPNSTNANFPPNQFHQQNGGFTAPHVSPNPGAVPSWNTTPSLPYNTPSPLSSISSDNPSPPPPFNTFRQPAAVQHLPAKLPPRGPQVPIIPSDVPPGTTTGTSGNDWEVNCLGAMVKLKNSDLWKNFENVVMEMVISKHGRRMFPVLEYDVQGLHPQKLYSVFVDFVLANKYVWKFSEQKWNPSGLAPEEDFYDKSHRVCLHPESPATGEIWNKRGVSFSKMKLSNHLHTDSDKLSLKSLHKYQPRLHVVEVDPRDPSIQTNLRTFIIPKTQFMTVTLYHNTDVAQLKINLNPFARCFRDKEISPRSVESTPSPTSVNESHITNVTSPWNQANDVTNATVCHEPQQITRVQNPVPESDLKRAKDFMQQQLNTMTQLVKAQDALSGCQTTTTTVSTVDVTSLGIENEEQNKNLATVDFDRELEGLLSNIDDKPQEPNKKTVHHYAPTTSNDVIKTPSAKRVKKNDGNPLDKYELLNVDRCFPPNAVAPLSNTLPFDVSKVTASAYGKDGSKAPLPTFFKCSYYQEQAAQAAINSIKQEDVKPNLPVIYVPKIKEEPKDPEEGSTSDNKNNLFVTSPESGADDILSAALNAASAFVTSPTNGVTNENNEIIENSHQPNSSCRINDIGHVPDITSPTTSAQSNYMTSFNPYAMPTLSPKSLQQFIDPDINDMMSGNKRKCSFDDDIDDDVFGGSDEASLMNACGIFNPQSQSFLPNTNFFVEQK